MKKIIMTIVATMSMTMAFAGNRNANVSNENNAYDMAKFVNQFDKIATELGCALIYAHHFSKGAQGAKTSMDRSSGSGVFARDPDAILTATALPLRLTACLYCLSH